MNTEDMHKVPEDEAAALMRDTPVLIDESSNEFRIRKLDYLATTGTIIDSNSVLKLRTW